LRQEGKEKLGLGEDNLKHRLEPEKREKGGPPMRKYDRLVRQQARGGKAPRSNATTDGTGEINIGD